MRIFANIFTFVFLLILSMNCTDSGDSLPYPTVTYHSELFIDGESAHPDYIVKPYRIVYDNYNKEFIIESKIPSSHRTGIFSFSEDGEFKELLRTAGPGGDDPTTLSIEFSVSSNGERVFYNGTTKHFRIVAADGSELHYFRIDTTVNAYADRFYVNNNSEILFYAFADKHNLHQYSFTGELVAKFDENKYPGKNDKKILQRTIFYNTGYPFQVNNGEYFLFIESTGMVRRFDKNGKLIGEARIAIPEFRDMYDNYEKRVKMLEDTDTYPSSFFNRVVYRNDKFYVYVKKAINDGSFFGYRDKFEKLIHVLDTELNIKKRIILKDEFLDNITIRDENRVRYSLDLNFDVNEKEEIFVTLGLKSKILKFVPTK